MNLKKYIRLKNENTHKPSCAEENKERYLQLLAQVQANEAAAAAVKRPIKMWVGLATLFSVIAALVIAISVVSAHKNPILYSDDNINSVASTYSDLKNNITSFELNLEANSIEKVKLYYDTVSGDKLYFNFKAKLNTNIISFYVKINKNYNYKFELDEEIINNQLTDYSVTYSRQAKRGDSFIRYRGYIELTEETVYFDYTQTPALGDEAFFDSIQAIINIK